MKTIFRLLCGLMAIAITTACSHEELLQTEPVQKPAEGKIVSVKAYTPSEQPASRLAFNDQGTEGLKLLWSEGDAFTAVVGNDKVTFTYDANTKEFSGTLPDGATLTDVVSAYYPAYENEYTIDLSTQTGALNSATTYMEGEYDATAQAFKFNHSTAILKVAFSGLPDGAEIESISVNVISVGNTSQITFSNAANPLYINLPALAKGSKLVFYVETTAGLYTSIQTVTVDAGIEVGKFYVAPIALAKATVCNLPTGITFRSFIGIVIGDATSIVFEANSTETGGTQIDSSTAYAKVVGTTLKIYTAANEFVFNENCSSMFYSLEKIQTIDFGNHINTDNVTDMSNMFDGCFLLESLDLSSFNTENVTIMKNMFADCEVLTSLDVSSFNTENVTLMNDMFEGCERLVSLDVSSFNTANVTDMNSMFFDCSALTSLDLSSFNTANVTDMSNMFESCERLVSLDVSSFNTANVTEMYYMFKDCFSLTSLDLSRFDFSKVTDFLFMFYELGNSAENKPIPVYVTAAGYNILKDKDTNIPNSATYVYPCELPTGSTFNAAVNSFLESNTSLTKIKFIANSDNANTNNPIETSGAYMVAGSDNTLEIHTAAAEFVFNADCSSMFAHLSTITAVDFNGCVNTEKVTAMNEMFDSCSALTSLDLSSFNTAKVTSMAYMFQRCSSLESITFGNSFNTQNVTFMVSMFFECSALTSLNLRSFNTAKVTTMNTMFSNCYIIRELDLSSFDFGKVADFYSMFTNLGRDVDEQQKPVYIYVKDENDKAKLEAEPIGIANYSYAEIHIKNP